MVPTINDEPRNLGRLTTLWQMVNDDTLDVTFDFSGCTFLGQNAVAFLGGLARLIAYRNGHCQFAWNTLEDRVQTNLRQNGFETAMAGRQGGWEGHSIPYREDREADSKVLMDFLQDRWL